MRGFGAAAAAAEAAAAAAAAHTRGLVVYSRGGGRDVANIAGLVDTMAARPTRQAMQREREALAQREAAAEVASAAAAAAAGIADAQAQIRAGRPTEVKGRRCICDSAHCNLPVVGEMQGHKLSSAGGVDDRMPWLNTLCRRTLSVEERQSWAEDPKDRKVHTSHFRNRDKYWTEGKGGNPKQLRLRTGVGPGGFCSPRATS
jgi:hypothetical protein